MYVNLPGDSTEHFWDFNIGHLIDIGLLVVAWLTLYFTRKNDLNKAYDDNQKSVNTQVEMHTENRIRLDILTKFHMEQSLLNAVSQEQITLLREQTAALKQMAEAQSTRLEFVEKLYFKSMENK